MDAFNDIMKMGILTVTITDEDTPIVENTLSKEQVCQCSLLLIQEL